MKRLKVCEIFYSIQGESTYAGLPFVFVRLSGCNLRCSFCDTTYAYYEGEYMREDEILERVLAYDTDFVEITGGEPLLQEGTISLIERLLSLGKKVLLETNGSFDIGSVPKECVKIVDVKCPGSGMSDKMFWGNLEKLGGKDEVKFVILDKADYEFAKDVMKRYSIFGERVLISPVFSKLSPSLVASWMLSDKLFARLQIQIHKYIFGEKRGV